MRENRKIDKPKRTKRLPETRVSLEELAMIKAKIAKTGLSQSEYQRQALLNGVVIIRDNAIDRKAVNELAAIGNNLNQLVRKEHIHDESDTQKMRDILKNIDAVIMGVVNDP